MAAASASPPGSTPRSRGRSPPAATSSATTRSGPTTTRAPRAWRRWPSSPPRRPRIDLGVAVIALDRTPPEAIAADIERLGLDPARLWLGVGAGFSEKPLTRMRESLPELRERLPGVRLVLAAMGPKMCALAGAEFDGAFFNWMTPEFAAGAREKVEAGAARGRPRHPARLRLRPHRRRPRRRRAPGQGGVLLPRPPQGLPRPLRPPRRARGHRRRRRRRTRPTQQLAAYTALDTLVVRGLASATVEAMTAVAAAQRDEALDGWSSVLSATQAAAIAERRATPQPSVRRQVLVPVAEDLEGAPEALLGALLVERGVDVGDVEGVDGRGEGLDLALALLDRARERDLRGR